MLKLSAAASGLALVLALVLANSTVAAAASLPATLILSPALDTTTVGIRHTTTATVLDALGQPVPGVTVRFAVSGANGTGDSCVTFANGQCTFMYTGFNAGTDDIVAYADTNNSGVHDPTEPTATAVQVWTPPRITLLPAAGTNTVGVQHCVTATLSDEFNKPVQSIPVRFSVPTHVATGAHPFSGSRTTDVQGQATFCFTASLPGLDAIHAFADTNGNGTEDPTEAFANAAKVWTAPASTSFCEVTITTGGWIITDDGDRANFGGNAKVSGDGSTVDGQEEYQDHGPADSMNVKSIEIIATTCGTDTAPETASIFGRATIDGSGDYIFRIDVTDGGNGGSSDTYGITLSTGYVSGQHQLGGGNVNIHKN